MTAKCPRCGKETELAGNPHRPFCGERCKLIDLGYWISENYRIPEQSTDEDENGATPSSATSEKE